jgi:hypothetical protein
MPPRHAYWTILVDGQPTAFRAAEVDELLPTFNRIKQKHPSAVMRWFQRGKLWESRDAALAAMRAGFKVWSGGRLAPPRRARGENDGPDASREVRDRGWRPGGDHRDPRERFEQAKKARWRRFKDKVRAKSESRVSGPARQEPAGNRPPRGAADRQRGKQSSTRPLRRGPHGAARRPAKPRGRR